MTPRRAGLFLLAVCLWPASALAQSIYVTSASTVSVVDTTTNTVTAKITEPVDGEGIGVTPDGTKVFVAQDVASGTVTVIDPATERVVRSIVVGEAPRMVAVTPDGRKAYVPNSLGAGTISVIDTASETVTKTISDNGFASGIAISPDGTRAYVANELAGTVSVIDTGTDTIVDTITIGASTAPIGVVTSNDGGTLYVSEFKNAVAVVDVATGAVRKTITVGNISSPYAFSLAIAPNGKRLYIANERDGTVSAIDTASNTVVATIPVGINPVGIAVTPDSSRAYVANLTSGTLSVIDTASNSVTGSITIGFQPNGIAIGKTPPSPLVAAVLPGSRSVQVNSPATIFATMLNSGSTALSNCRISAPSNAPFSLSLAYQTTDPTTNAATGLANHPVTIPANGAQTFLLTFSDHFADFASALALLYSCDGAPPAPSTPGVNMPDILFSSTPISDIIALGATPSGDGILNVPVGGSAAFAVATADVGVSGSLTASVDTGSASLPVSATLCQTNPSNAQCLSPPAASAVVNFTAGSTPTFSVFVNATGSIAFAPGTARIFLRFKDSGGTSHGSTSAAIRTN